MDVEPRLMHLCLHGRRWSPVHAGHWMADAVQIVTHSRSELDWGVVVDEALNRGLALQMGKALRLLREVGRAPVPEAVLRATDSRPASRRDRLEYRAKARPVVSADGLFGLWCAWSRSRQPDGRRPPCLRDLAANVGVGARWRLVPWFGGHLRRRVVALFDARPPASSRPRFARNTVGRC